MVFIELPPQLKTLIKQNEAVGLTISKPEVSLTHVIDQLEHDYPALKGTLRDPITKKRRPKIRFFACQKDYTFHDPHAPLPQVVRDGQEPLLVVGAISGG